MITVQTLLFELLQPFPREENHMLQVNAIEKYYGSKNNVTKALDRVSFHVAEGEFIAIMGASGPESDGAGSHHGVRHHPDGTAAQ